MFISRRFFPCGRGLGRSSFVSRRRPSISGAERLREHSLYRCYGKYLLGGHGLVLHRDYGGDVAHNILAERQYDARADGAVSHAAIGPESEAIPPWRDAVVCRRDNNFRIATTAAGSPTGIAADGADLWVVGGGNPGTITRVRASDGAVVATWTGALNATDILAFSGRIYATSIDKLYSLDPTQNGGQVQTVASSLPIGHSLAFDGQFLWRVEGQNVGIFDGTGRINQIGSFGTVLGMVFDGTSLWLVTSTGLCKHNAGDDVVAWNCSPVTGGFASASVNPIFDGINLVIPDRDANKIVIVRPSTTTVVGTITGNGLDKPGYAAFDGERIAFSNAFANTVSIFRASDFSPLGVVNLGGGGVQYQIASDGLHFFVLNASNNKVIRL